MAWTAVAVAATAVSLLRMWTSLPLESLWSEDGGTWLAGALDRPPHDALATPYNGYLQTVSRLVAEPVAALPVEWYPAAMAIAGAAIVTGCALVVWRASAPHIENVLVRGTLAAMVIVLGVVGTETLANVTNSIWFLLFACFWVLLWRPAATAAALGAAIVVFLAAVSNVGVVFLVPLWLLRLIAVRHRGDLIIVAAFAAGLAVQLGLSLGELDTRGEPGDPQPLAIPAGQPFSSEPYWDWELVPAFAQRIVGGALGGQDVNGYLWEQLGTPYGIVLGLGAVALVALAALRSDARTRILVPLAVFTALALFLVSGYRRWSAGGALFYWPEGTSNAASAHYMVTPALLMLSALLVWLDAGPRQRAVSPRSRRRWSAVQAAAVALVWIGALSSFSVGDPAVRGGLPWSEALAAGRAECRRPDVEKVAIATGEPPFSGYPLPLACAELDRP